MGNTVTKEKIDEVLKEANFHVQHAVFGKCCIVTAQLSNGFTVVGTSACVDPDNYDSQIGYEIAKKKIEDKLWELEGYKLQCELHELKQKGRGY
ncbi:Gp49 family protein [Bacillus cereus]|uniref:Gp49 family protein n=1 Tax=Bacillus cereus TaxID=1396 RepID=UPI003556300D